MHNQSSTEPRRHPLVLFLLWVAGIAGALLLTLLLFFGIGYWHATRDPHVVEVSLPMENLPPGSQYHVLLASDIHTGNPDMRPERLARIVRQMNALKPDMILLAGDYHGGKMLDWPGIGLETALAPLGQLRAPLGVFAVIGNHDTPRWTPWAFGKAGNIRLLVNAHADAGPFTVVGFNSSAYGSNWNEGLKGIDPRRPTLLLFHEPDQILGNAPVKGDMLALAGHTHGGQVMLPLIGAPYDHVSGKPPCRRGACVMNGTRVYVTSGIGTSWFPIRYNVPPEIVLLTLYSGRKSGTER